jgi:multiple sugar transport system permease protein
MPTHIVGPAARNLLFVLAILFFGVPIVWLLLAPTKTTNGLQYLSPLAFGNLDQLGVTATNLFGYSDGIIWRWALNSLWYTSVSLVVAVAVAVPAGYALAKLPFRGSRIVLFVTLLTMIVPSAALILPLYLEMSAFGLTNTPWGVILPLTFHPFGVYLIYLYARSSIPDSIIEAARLDGCSEFAILLRIFVPLAWPAIAMVAFFAFVGAWNAFFLPYIMLNDQNLATLQTGLQLLVSSTGAIGGGGQSNIPIHAPEVALAAIVSVLPILMVFLFAQRFLVAGQLAGAEKG